MNKAIRIAIAAAFGVSATLPAFADFERNGPNDKQGQGVTSLQEVNPPALDGNSTVTSSRWSDGRQYQADASQYNSDRPASSERHFFRSDRKDHRFMSADGYGHMSPTNQVYGGVSETGSFSEPGMKAGEFNWDHYTNRSDRDYRTGTGS